MIFLQSLPGLDAVSFPSIDISGWLSNSWIWVLFVAMIGVILIVGVAMVLFFTTYNRKIEFYDNISGRGYTRTLVTRARVISLGTQGEEVLKSLRGGKILTAYGRKMGRNTYWFAKGPDGYFYNITLGDLDTKLGTLDIEPVNPNIRMQHHAIAKISSNRYGEKKGFIEKYGVSIILLFMVLVVMVGFYLTAGQIREGLIASNNPQVAETNQETAEILRDLSTRLDAIQRGSNSNSGGLISANDAEDIT